MSLNILDIFMRVLAGALLVIIYIAEGKAAALCSFGMMGVGVFAGVIIAAKNK